MSHFNSQGWNDVGFHGSGQIPTPNIDALAYSGLLLDKYYVTPICTPSRSALMTGKYPIHIGMHHGVNINRIYSLLELNSLSYDIQILKGAEPRGLPLNEKILPEYLQDLGYSTHIVGKWHLGFYKKEYTPTYRGFNSHVGYWSGHHDYFDHTAVEEVSNIIVKYVYTVELNQRRKNMFIVLYAAILGSRHET